jgi:hypothetical protein
MKISLVAARLPGLEESALTARRRTVLRGAAFVVPAILLLVFCVMAAPKIPVWDSWSWILWLQRIRTREIGFHDLLLLTHIEHPYGFPTAVFVYLGSVWDYSLKPMAIMSTMAIVANGAILFHQSRKCGLQSIAALFAIAMISMSYRQYENVLFGFQLGFPLTVMFGLGAVMAAASTGRAVSVAGRSSALLVLLACLLCGSTSSAASFAVFPAVMVTFLLLTRRPSVLASLLVALLAGLWLSHYVPVISAMNAGRPPVADIVKGLFILAGSPLFDSITASLATGIVVICSFIVFAFVRRNGTDSERLMIAMGLLSLGFIGILACGRGHMGGINPPRYATFAIPLVVAMISLAIGRIDYYWQRRIAIPLIALVIYSALVATRAGLAQAKLIGSDTKMLTQIVLNHGASSDAEIGKLNPGRTELIRELVMFLEQNRWNVFSR